VTLKQESSKFFNSILISAFFISFSETVEELDAKFFESKIKGLQFCSTKVLLADSFELLKGFGVSGVLNRNKYLVYDRNSTSKAGSIIIMHNVTIFRVIPKTYRLENMDKMREIKTKISIRIDLRSKTSNKLPRKIPSNKIIVKAIIDGKISLNCSKIVSITEKMIKSFFE